MAKSIRRCQTYLTATVILTFIFSLTAMLLFHPAAESRERLRTQKHKRLRAPATTQKQNLSTNPTDVELSKDEIETLVKENAPLAFYQKDEIYLPTNAELLLKDMEPQNYTRDGKEMHGLKLKNRPSDKEWLKCDIQHSLKRNSLGADCINKTQNRHGNLEQAKAYVNVKTYPLKGYIDIQYWLLYAFNGHGTLHIKTHLPGPVVTGANIDIDDTQQLLTCGQHEGDWEHVTVRVITDVSSFAKEVLMHFAKNDWRYKLGDAVSRYCTSNGMAACGAQAVKEKLKMIYMAQHGGGHWYSAKELMNKQKLYKGRKNDTGRLIFFPSLNGHPAYPYIQKNYSKKIYDFHNEWKDPVFGLHLRYNDVLIGLLDNTEQTTNINKLKDDEFHNGQNGGMAKKYDLQNFEILAVHVDGKEVNMGYGKSWMDYNGRWGLRVLEGSDDSKFRNDIFHDVICGNDWTKRVYGSSWLPDYSVVCGSAIKKVLGNDLWGKVKDDEHIRGECLTESGPVPPWEKNSWHLEGE